MKTALGPLDHSTWRLQALQMVVALLDIRTKAPAAVIEKAEAELADLYRALWPAGSSGEPVTRGGDK